MGEPVRDPAYTAGQYDPTPAGDGYIRGTWDEVERALLAGRITDEEYERMARTAPVLRPRDRGDLMPNQPRPDNPARSVRVPDGLWRAAKERAAERGETVTDVLIRALRRYTR